MLYRIFIFVLGMCFLEKPAFSAGPCTLVSVAGMLAAGNYGALPTPENFSEKQVTEALKDREKLLESADEKAQTTADQVATTVPPEKRGLFKKMKDYAVGKFKRVEQRYGRRYAVLMTGAFVIGKVALPIVPGAVFALPIAAVAEVHLLVRGRAPKQENQDNSGMKLFDLGDSMASEPSPTVQLSDAEILALAKKLSWEIELFMQQEGALN